MSLRLWMPQSPIRTTTPGVGSISILTTSQIDDVERRDEDEEGRRRKKIMSDTSIDWHTGYQSSADLMNG